METQVRTPQMVFMQPQRLVVPLFQRPYVWNEDNQWEPLWNDIVRVAERILAKPADKHHPHFLGAVVLQQVQKNTGQMQERTIIDGQQRLTTLQLMLDALHAELLAAEATQPAMRIEPLVRNAEPFCSRPEDQFKVWPTNRDRPAFNSVMSADPPVDHDATGHKGERMVEAHRFFCLKSRNWLSAEGPTAVSIRGAAIETAVRDLLQMVVIDLAADENAQEIFETLNARGAQLSAADLIKNFVFQRLLENGADVEESYQRYWKDFETGFWEAEINVGRLRYPRSAIFLNHWLIARTGEEVIARQVFDRFKRFATHDASIPMEDLLRQIFRASNVYRNFIMDAEKPTGNLSRLALFGYRTSVLESEVVKPLILFLLDPEQAPVPNVQLTKAINVVESWMVRRMLVRATAKRYNNIFVELIALLRNSGRDNVGDVIEAHLASQTGESSYWPDDEEVKQELEELMAYRRLHRGRLRMVLEAIEDQLRGWRGNEEALGQERVARGELAIEHVMPRKWQTTWPIKTPDGEEERDRLIHTLGNLTLLRTKLNSKVSNGAWLGNEGKRSGVNAHDVLFLNRGIIKVADDAGDWTDEAIKARTQELARVVTQIWPVPANHRSGFASKTPRLRKKIGLSDLIAGGILEPGMSLFPRRKKHLGQNAILLPDGRLEVDGLAFSRPSEAATSIAGKRTNGWWFFLVDQESKKSLRKVRNDYVNAMAVDAEDDEPDDDGDDDENHDDRT